MPIRREAARSSRATKAGEHGLRGLDFTGVGSTIRGLELGELGLIEIKGLIVTSCENDDLGPPPKGGMRARPEGPHVDKSENGQRVSSSTK